MIVTVTPNPSLDRTLQVDELVVGQVNRTTAARTDAGGKGVNVSRALAAHRIATRAVVPMGGSAGRELGSLLGDIGVHVVPVPLNGTTRTNITLVDAEGVVTKVNEPGAHLGPAATVQLVQRMEASVDASDWVASCGSLPPGVPEDLHATITRAAHAMGARVAVDTSGTPLAAAVGAGPDLIKPNLAELEELVGRRLADPVAVAIASHDLRREGVGAVLTSLGADGAVLVNAHGAWHAVAPASVVRSDVGAGDAALAGFLAAGAHGPTALGQAVAWGTAAVAQPGTAMPAPADIDVAAVVLTTLDPSATPKEHA
jgi:1-phosphofructokinase